jgi:hypothetical protein
VYVTSDMACSMPNSATPMSQARITAQNNRVARIGNKFTAGNAILSNLVQQLGGIGIGNPPGTTPRTTTPNFANSPACSTAVLPGGNRYLYGKRIPVKGGYTGQPIVQADGTIALPSTPGAPAAPASATNANSVGSNSPAPIPSSTAGTAAGALGQSAATPGGSSPGVGQPSGTTSEGQVCTQRPVYPTPASAGLSSPLLWGLLLLIIGASALTGGKE